MLCIQYTLAMVGYGPDLSQSVVEFKSDFNATEYTKGNGYEKVGKVFFFFILFYYCLLTIWIEIIDHLVCVF